MLKNYKSLFAPVKSQYALVNLNGLVLESDNVLFTLKKEESIFTFHPFFETFKSLLKPENNSHQFPCVHLSLLEQELVCDITLHTFADKNHALVIITDNTKQYQEFQELMQVRNQAIIDAELLALKNHLLKEQENFKNKFIANFSHELRTPLTSIIVFANLLSKTKLNNEQAQHIKLIRESAANLKMMLDDTLNISQIASGKLRLQNKQFNLHGLIQYIESVYTAKAQTKGLSFSVMYDDKIPEFIEGDYLRVNQVLTNLLENALKFTDKGKISLKVSLNQKRANKASIRFEVSDTGMGISENDLQQIFETFTQLDNANQFFGAGLGLSIVKGLLELMGSSIQVKSKPKKGTTFFFDINFKFPVVTTTNANKQNTHYKSPKDLIKDLKAKTKSRKLKVLLVEDDKLTQMVVFKILADTQSFYIDLLNDGGTVLDEIKQNEYDLILMDINLPDAQGHKIAKKIKSQKHYKKVPIIGVTDIADSKSIKAFKKNGINDIVTKPFDEETLLTTILTNLK